MSTNFTTPALYVRSNKYFNIVAASRLRRDMSTNFTTPALYVRSNKYFVPLRRPARGGVCLSNLPHPLFMFDQKNIFLSFGCPALRVSTSPNYPKPPLYIFDQTNIFIPVRRPALQLDISTNFTTPALYVRSNKYFYTVAASRPAAGYIYQFHHTRSLHPIKQIFYTVAASRPAAGYVY